MDRLPPGYGKSTELPISSSSSRSVGDADTSRSRRYKPKIIHYLGASDGRRAGTGAPACRNLPSESDQCEWPDDALRSVGISIVQLLHFRQAIVP